MRIERGKVVLLTGAPGGLGTHMAAAFAARGVRLALVSFPGVALEAMSRSLSFSAIETIAITADLRDAAQRHSMLEQVRARFGPIDILVNNAGVEYTSAYHDLAEDNIREVLNVNLEAPMILSRLVLPEMLRRGGGHIVNVSSLAGKSGPAFQEPYAATKAGLVAFTLSLRATYHGRGVSASVVTPGFVEAGIYTRLKREGGRPAPALLGTSRPETVANAVLRAIEKDAVEIIVSRYPMRPLLAMAALWPGFGAWVTEKTGTNAFFRRVAEAHKSVS